MEPIDLWLDDMRPAPPGWLHIKTVDAAKELLRSGRVRRASLDHDLGACDSCLKGMCAEEWLEKHQYKSMPNCEHFGTGYQLVCWMEEFGIWPKERPTVHSANPVGRAKMEVAIRREWEKRT